MEGETPPTKTEGETPPEPNLKEKTTPNTEGTETTRKMAEMTAPEQKSPTLRLEDRCFYQVCIKEQDQEQDKLNHNPNNESLPQLRMAGISKQLPLTWSRLDHLESCSSGVMLTWSPHLEQPDPELTRSKLSHLEQQ